MQKYSRMRRDRYDGDHILPRAIYPENPISRWRIIFGVGFEDVFAVGASLARKFVGLQAGMSGIVFK